MNRREIGIALAAAGVALMGWNAGVLLFLWTATP